MFHPAYIYWYLYVNAVFRQAKSKKADRDSLVW